MTRFDTFLQANDAKAHKAMKHAEEMTKVKQERLQKIKHLRGKIAQIQSEISKYKEQKEECVKFRKFLDHLTPQEWKQKQAELRRLYFYNFGDAVFVDNFSALPRDLFRVKQ